MEVSTSKFWQTVKEQMITTYPIYPGTPFICDNSILFNKVWNAEIPGKSIIIELAREFLTVTKTIFELPEKPYMFNYILFTTFVSTTRDERYSIRMQFIDWCIAKFK